jgi:hypothetical protein
LTSLHGCWGVFTVITADPATPPTVAVMAAFPAATPVAIPEVDTLTTEASDDVQITESETAFPFSSLATAVNCWVPPTSTVADVGDTVTDTTLGAVGLLLHEATRTAAAAAARVR